MTNEVAYDANFSVGKHRGMGKYVNSFVEVLAKEFNLRPIGLLRGKSIPVFEYYSMFGFSNYILWEQLSLFKFRNKYKGIIFFPYNTAPLLLKKSNKNVLFVHDLIYLNSYNSTSLKQKVGAIYRKFIVPKVVNKFNHIVTVSEYSKQQICAKLNVKEENISVIPNSIKVEYGFELLNPTFNERENFIFHIGGEPEYKNSMGLLCAFAALPSEYKNNMNIKIIGIRNKNIIDDYIEKTKELGIYGKVFFLDYQTDEQIVELYKKAKMFVFPSFEEGFGIPLIEAMKYGCPLLCSNRSCFPEIAGDAAHYFNPSDIISLSKKIIEVLNDFTTVNEKVQIGYKRVMNYSYEKFKQNVISWFQKII